MSDAAIIIAFETATIIVGLYAFYSKHKSMRRLKEDVATLNEKNAYYSEVFANIPSNILLEYAPEINDESIKSTDSKFIYRSLGNQYILSNVPTIEWLDLTISKYKILFTISIPNEYENQLFIMLKDSNVYFRRHWVCDQKDLIFFTKYYITSNKEYFDKLNAISHSGIEVATFDKLLYLPNVIDICKQLYKQ